MLASNSSDFDDLSDLDFEDFSDLDLEDLNDFSDFGKYKSKTPNPNLSPPAFSDFDHLKSIIDSRVDIGASVGRAVGFIVGAGVGRAVGVGTISFVVGVSSLLFE